jgi:hypothetical protein
VHTIAPSFDHASSLGRELRDDRRKAMLARGLVEKYALKGSGGIYWHEDDPKGENPLNLAIKAAKEFPNYFRPWLEMAQKLHMDDIGGIVERVPADWMSLDAKQFCLNLMSVTLEKLKAIQL